MPTAESLCGRCGKRNLECCPLLSELWAALGHCVHRAQLGNEQSFRDAGALFVIRSQLVGVARRRRRGYRRLHAMDQRLPG